MSSSNTIKNNYFNKTPKMSKKKSDLLKSEVEKQEKEFELIKEFLERKNGSQKSSEIFGKLNLNFDVSGRKTSAKIPKKLNQKEKEKREFFRRMKEVDELGNLQAKLFKQVGNRRKMKRKTEKKKMMRKMIKK